MKLTRHAIGLLAGGLLATAALSATAVTASLGGFSATVTDANGAAGSGTLLLSESHGSTTCISTGTGTASSSSISTNDNTTCPIQVFGGTSASNLEPGGTPVSTILTLSNPGSLPGSSLTLAPGTCTATGNASPGGATNTYFGTDTLGFCGKVDLTIEAGSGTSATCIFPVASTAPCATPSSAGTLASLASSTLAGIASGATATYTFSVSIDTSATNADQGLSAALPLTWTLNQ